MRNRGFLTAERRRELIEASYEAGMITPEGELRFDDPDSFMEFLDMEVEDTGDYWDPDPIDSERRMDQAASPASQPPPQAENAANSRPSLCNNFIDDYKLAEVLKKNGLPKLRIFIVGVLGKSRTKVSLTETRFVSDSLILLNTPDDCQTIFCSLYKLISGCPELVHVGNLNHWDILEIPLTLERLEEDFDWSEIPAYLYQDLNPTVVETENGN